MTLEYRIGDVFDRLAEIPDGSIDLIVTSPPFLALRSYLPADHPDKAKEIGSEPTPAEFLDTMLALSGVCQECGQPSERITENVSFNTDGEIVNTDFMRGNRENGISQTSTTIRWSHNERTSLGWTDCGHNAWRTGIVLDPFAGSGTTLEAAQAVGRHAIGIDLDSRNADLAQQRVGMFLTITDQPTQTPA